MVAKGIKRLGVGATASATVRDTSDADWTKSGKKKILSIGKQHTDDDDVIDGQGGDASSDEEGGRTSAFRERKRKLLNVRCDITKSANETDDVPKSKKKKKGKKERNAATAANIAEIRVDIPNASANESVITTNVSEANKDAERKKPKRKKSRSKQKNIRKDNRSETDRPSHLNVGHSSYAGRPLTNTTRTKLGLGTKTNAEPSSNPSSKNSNTNSMINNSGGGSESQSQRTASKEENTGELSKIGDCVVGDIGVNLKEGTNMKKKPRRKFKNC